MSVANELYKVSYVGRGDTGPYAITFPVALDASGDAQDVKVKLIDAAGAETDITATSTFTGLNVYTAASYAATYTIVLIRYPALTQPYTFPYRTSFPSRDFERALDRLVFAVQRVALNGDQALKAPIAESAPADIPSAVDRASMFLAFDASGDPIAATGVSSVPVTAAAETLLDDATISDILTTLGFSAFTKTLVDDASASAFLTTLGIITGLQNLTFTTLGTSKPNIEGYVDVGGTLVQLAAATPSGTPSNSTSNFIYVTSAGSVSLSVTKPTWSLTKRGWYNGLDRAVAWVRVDSAGLYKYHHMLPTDHRPVLVLDEIIEIGDWDMDSTVWVAINHELLASTIISVDVAIMDDSSTPTMAPHSNLVNAGTGGTEVDVDFYVTSSAVNINRRTGGIYDNASYNQTSFNRGWITLRHNVLL